MLKITIAVLIIAAYLAFAFWFAGKLEHPQDSEERILKQPSVTTTALYLALSEKHHQEDAASRN